MSLSLVLLASAAEAVTTDVPLPLVISLISGVVTFLMGIILVLARTSFESQKRIWSDQIEAAKGLADRALVECGRLNERAHLAERELSLLKERSGTVSGDIERMRDSMVTRDIFQSEMGAQNKQLARIDNRLDQRGSTTTMRAMTKDAISRVDPDSEPPPMPPRPRLPSRNRPGE